MSNQLRKVIFGLHTISRLLRWMNARFACILLLPLSCIMYIYIYIYIIHTHTHTLSYKVKAFIVDHVHLTTHQGHVNADTDEIHVFWVNTVKIYEMATST